VKWVARRSREKPGVQRIDAAVLVYQVDAVDRRISAPARNSGRRGGVRVS